MRSLINRLFPKSQSSDQASSRGGGTSSDKAPKDKYRVQVSSKEARERAKDRALTETQGLASRRQEERERAEALNLTKNGTTDHAAMSKSQTETANEPFYGLSAVEAGSDPSSTHWTGRSNDTRSSDSPASYGPFYGPGAVEDGADPSSTHWSGH